MIEIGVDMEVDGFSLVACCRVTSALVGWAFWSVGNGVEACFDVGLLWIASDL